MSATTEAAASRDACSVFRFTEVVRLSNETWRTRENLAAGLDGDLRRRCSVQYGSTLRNLGEYERSREVFRAAREASPDFPSLRVFEALTLQAAGEPNASIASLLDLIVAHVETPDIDRYKAAITANATAIRGQTTPLSR